MIPSMEKLTILFFVFVVGIAGTTATKLSEDEVVSLSKMLNKASRQKPKGMETPGKHVSSDARHVIKWNFFDRIRQLKEALFRRMMKEAIAKRWTQDDFIIRGTGTPKPHTTLPTIAPTLLTTEKTTTTVATTTTQGALQTTLADFWKTLRKLWGNRHNPFG